MKEMYGDTYRGTTKSDWCFIENSVVGSSIWEAVRSEVVALAMSVWWFAQIRIIMVVRVRDCDDRGCSNYMNAL